MRAALFDLDGTLADTMPICYEAFRRVFREELGREFSDAEIIENFGPSEEGVLRAVLGSEREAAASARYLEHYERLHAQVRELFPGVAEVLQACKAAGMRRGIVTGKGARSAEISTRLLGLQERFEVIEAGSPDAWVKIDRLRKILEGWKLPASEAFYLGDHPSDVSAARKLGLVALAAAWDPAADLESLRAMRPDEIFVAPREMLDWLAACCR